MARVAKFAERTGGGVVPTEGLEPAASASAGQRSNPLSYGRTLVIVHRDRAGDGASVVVRASVRATKGRRYVSSASSLATKSSTWVRHDSTIARGIQPS